ncbi:MAG: DMT family transporter [Clostridia bacterium]|nr:DMT family transporter [Clostridia bacterium]MDD4797908.1 DMT family transporter [Clostridia bacterium]
MLLFLLLAAASGLMMAVQGSINGSLGKIIGVWQGNLLVHAIGLAAVLAILLLSGGGKGDWSKISDVPWYLYSGGLINAAIIFAVMSSIAALGAGKATSAIIVGQLSAALIIDAFGFFGLDKQPLTLMKGGGLILMLIGARFILK